MSDCIGNAAYTFLSCFSVPENNSKKEEAGGLVPIKRVPPRDERILFMKALFFAEYDNPPEFFVKVPGRVNLIGELIDYCSFPVLPMALDQDITIAATFNEKIEINIKNSNENYPPYSVALTNSEKIVIEPNKDGTHIWYNYILCGVKGAMKYLGNKFNRGLDILVDGNIPLESGLSSSSALVSAGCLVFLHAQKQRISKTDIASLCATSERLAGMQDGYGIDQVIAFHGKKYSAQCITPVPLNASPVYLPKNAAFVVAHSMTKTDKAAKNEFDSRVVECRLAAKIIAEGEGIETGDSMINLSLLRICQDSTLDDMIELVHKYLPKDKYTENEICAMLNINEDELTDMFLTPNAKDLKIFKLKQRALHVYEEAKRVENFQKVCSEVNCANGNIINALGNLMSESQESLKFLFESSEANVDLLVDLSKKFGVNARLTGVGWGGCIVTICREEEVNEYMDFLTDEYYVKHHQVKIEDISKYLIASRPNDGAAIYQNCCIF